MLFLNFGSEEHEIALVQLLRKMRCFGHVSRAKRRTQTQLEASQTTRIDPAKGLCATFMYTRIYRPGIALCIDFSTICPESLEMKKPRDFHLRAKSMAESMGLEPTRLLHPTRFPGELLSRSVNSPHC